MATYILVINITDDAEISVGSFGKIPFKNGLYLYVGSARRGLAKRVARHLSHNKRLHWHIDYILSVGQAKVLETWAKEKDQECRTAREILTLKETEIVKKGLGASDCKCLTHFCYFPGRIIRIQHWLKREDFHQIL